MTDKKKPAGAGLLHPIHATNALILVSWRTLALTIALCIRLVASLVIAIGRRVRRARIVRW